jgi:hypothetical protein
MHWKRLPIKENYQLIPYICSGTAIMKTAMPERGENDAKFRNLAAQRIGESFRKKATIIPFLKADL